MQRHAGWSELLHRHLAHDAVRAGIAATLFLGAHPDLVHAFADRGHRSIVLVPRATLGAGMKLTPRAVAQLRGTAERLGLIPPS